MAYTYQYLCSLIDCRHDVRSRNIGFIPLAPGATIELENQGLINRLWGPALCI